MLLGRTLQCNDIYEETHSTTSVYWHAGLRSMMRQYLAPAWRGNLENSRLEFVMSTTINVHVHVVLRAVVGTLS